jgi:pimeloyl-ACP methyl ester carboxylesterase
MTADEIAERRAASTWPERLATAPTMIREGRIEEGWLWEPEHFGTIKVPTLLLTGSETTTDLAEVTVRTAAAIPKSRVHVLEGHGHLAHRTDPAVVAQVLRAWLL